MFETIHLSNLRHSECIQFIRNFLEITGDHDLEVLKLKLQSDQLANLINKMGELYKPERASALTKTLQEDDERRDKALNGTLLVLNAYSYHYDAAFKMAADILLNSISKYGSGLSRQNYQAETATIIAILEDWKEDTNYTNALAKLNLTDWVDELEAANVKFNTDYMARTKEDAEAPDIKIRDVRKQVIETFYILIHRIEAFNTIGEEAAYSDIIKQSNSLIEKYNNILVMRSASAKEEEEETALEE